MKTINATRPSSTAGMMEAYRGIRLSPNPMPSFLGPGPEAELGPELLTGLSVGIFDVPSGVNSVTLKTPVDESTGGNGEVDVFWVK